MITAKTGWRVHREDKEVCASMWSTGADDIITVKGFESRMEAWLFIACYFVFLTTSRSDKATALIQEFSARVTH